MTELFVCDATLRCFFYAQKIIPSVTLS